MPAVAPTPKATVPLRFAAGKGKITLEGVVPGEDVRKKLIDDATGIYGAGNLIDKLTVDTGAAKPVWLAQASALMTQIKPGQPLSASASAGEVALAGVVASEAQKAERAKWAASFFGSGVTINNELIVQAPTAPVSNAQDVKRGDQISAAVTFATGSAGLSAEGKTLLDAIAPCLKDGKFEISGHTDNAGSPAGNARLSLVRASAVRAYMILQGVNADSIRAKGYGPNKPIADNGSAEGRAKNRRIEFAKS